MNKKQVFFVSMAIFLSLSFGFTLIFVPMKDKDFASFSLPIRQAVRNDEAVDADSNIDAVANVGTSNSTFSDATTLNDAYQGITEASAGGGSGVAIDDYIDQISDVDSSSDLGTHDVFADLQASDDVYNNISEIGGGGGYVVSVEPCTITLANGVTSNTCTLTESQTDSNTVPFSTYYTDPATTVDDYSSYVHDISISGSTVTATRDTAVGNGIYLNIYNVEFDGSAVVVKKGTFSMSGTSTTASVSASVLTKSFLVFYYRSSDTAVQQPEFNVRGYFSSTTQLTFVRDAGTGVTQGTWYVIEDTGSNFDVDAVDITLTGVASNTGSISAVDMAKTMVVGSSQGGSADDISFGSHSAYLSSTTAITVERGGATGNVVATMYAVEFSGDELVERGSIAFGTTDTALSDTSLSAQDWSEGMVQSGIRLTDSGYGVAAASSDNADSKIQLTLDDVNDEIDGLRTASGGTAVNVRWEAVLWIIGAGGGDTVYKMDLEMQFTNIANFTATHTLAIETGTFTGSEDINVTARSDTGSWYAIASDLTASTWNNFTILLNDTTFTIKLGGSDNADNSSLDGWNIDSIILVISGAGSTEDYVDNEDSDVDSIADTGTLTTFANMQDIASGDAILTETAGGGEIVFVDSVQATSTTQTVVLPAPTVSDDDVMIAVIMMSDDEPAISMSTVPSGWNLAVDKQVMDTPAVSPPVIWVYTKVASSESGTYTWVGSLTAGSVGVIYVFTGIDATLGTNGIIATGKSTQTGTGNDPTAPSLTITDGDSIMAMAWTDAAQTVTTFPTSDGLIGQETVSTASGGNGGTLSAGYELAIAGTSTGSYAWVMSAVDERSAFTMSFRATAGSSDYTLDQEVQFTGLTTGFPIANLSIFGGTQGTEALRVFIWNTTSSAWDSLFSDVQAGWNNVSILGLGWFGSTVTLNFNDTTKTSDVTTADVWNIDAVLIYIANSGGSNYRLAWEHQATSVPTGADNYYNLTIYGSSTENIDVYLWNTSSTSWNTTAIFTIGTTTQWYNASVTGAFLFGATMTWNYQDTVIASDTVQDILAIDYAGVYVWSMTVTVNQLPNATAIPNAGDTEFDSFPVNVTIDAGENFDFEIKCTEGNGSVCSGNWLFWDTDSNPAGYTQLTTSYQTVYTNQAYTTTNLNFWLWVVVPNGETRLPYSWTLDVRITLA